MLYGPRSVSPRPARGLAALRSRDARRSLARRLLGLPPLWVVAASAMSQYASKWDPLVLLQIADEVLKAADAEHPERVTQRAYDEARQAAGHDDSPRADKLAARFKVSWSRFAQVVITEEHPARVLAQADYRRAVRWHTETEIVSAIATAAAWLGTDHIDQASYERARLALNAVASRRHLHGRAAAPLPAVSVIRFRLSWADAVAQAGLQPPPRPVLPSMPRSAMLALFIEHCGFVPTREQLRQFARHHRIRAADHNEPVKVAMAAVAEHFEQLGRWCPPHRPGASPDDARARMTRDSPAVRAASEAYPARHPGWSLDDIRDAIAAAFDALGPGERLTADRYTAIVRQQPGLPTTGQVARTLRRHDTSWATLVREEAARRAAAARTRST